MLSKIVIEAAPGFRGSISLRSMTENGFGHQHDLDDDENRGWHDCALADVDRFGGPGGRRF